MNGFIPSWRLARRILKASASHPGTTKEGIRHALKTWIDPRRGVGTRLMAVLADTAIKHSQVSGTDQLLIAIGEHWFANIQLALLKTWNIAYNHPDTQWILQKSAREFRDWLKYQKAGHYHPWGTIKKDPDREEIIIIATQT